MRLSPLNASVRVPVVAGTFYPRDAAVLRASVLEYMNAASVGDAPTKPKALIVPHAGHIYSGVIAAAGYAQIAAHRTSIRRVVLIGPSHRVPLRGAAVPKAAVFATPLGNIPIDQSAKATLLARGDVMASDQPHALEHCLEVQLPFLQTLLDDFELLPIVVGSAAPDYIASLLADVWGDAATLVLTSSDLSHYHPYSIAQEIDAATSRAILNLQTSLSGEQACGAIAINGLLRLASERGLAISEIARCNSGDTAGDRSQVVGYGAFALHEPGHHTAQ
jgi:AmmeMemoRadiSam system protein B